VHAGLDELGHVPSPGRDGRRLKILVRALSNVLGYQDFLSIQSRLANKEFEPLGIGVTNLAYWHAKRGLKYGEPEALAQVKRWMEHQAFFVTEATVELAKERGPASSPTRPSYGQGIVPVGEARGGRQRTHRLHAEPHLDWEALREDMKQYGVRNATLMAIAPVESSSVVIDSTNGIEMPMALISVKKSKAGRLRSSRSRVQKLKNKYQLMWDQTDCIDYIKTAAVLAAYVDQSISTNTFYSPKHFRLTARCQCTLVAKNLMLAHKWGIKSFYYSLMDKQGAKGDSTVLVKA
jgi:ribonucleoside-diphosphate reductase alpha chain